MRATAKDVGTRTVWGGFIASGVVDRPGSGNFTVSKTGTGIYAVRWQPPFAHPPIASVQPVVAAFVATTFLGPDWMEVRTYGSAGAAAADVGTTFSVIGRLP